MIQMFVTLINIYVVYKKDSGLEHKLDCVFFRFENAIAVFLTNSYELYALDVGGGGGGTRRTINTLKPVFL